MRTRHLVLIFCLCATPALADGAADVSQVTATLIPGAGNISTITQQGSTNLAETDQMGSLGTAGIRQTCNNNISQIVQTGAGDLAVLNQIGSGLTMKIMQTGPAQHITITQRK
jgi:hypothetical protein